VQTQMYVALQLLPLWVPMNRSCLYCQEIIKNLKNRKPLPWSADFRNIWFNSSGIMKQNCFCQNWRWRNSKQIDKLEAPKSPTQKTNSRTRKKRFSLMILLKWICVRYIYEASKMPKANKLLILKVDTGIDVRTMFQELPRVLNRKIL
jgi:methionyl-tRNA synthetase